MEKMIKKTELYECEKCNHICKEKDLKKVKQYKTFKAAAKNRSKYEITNYDFKTGFYYNFKTYQKKQ